MCVRTTSARGAVMHMPQAENTPESGGTITLRTSSSAPSAAPCMPPPPPPTSRAKSRGSRPRCTETSFSALIMLASASRMMPLASAATLVAERLAERLQRLARELGSHLQPAAEEVVGREHAGDELRVGDRGLGASAPVGGRARIGARALRADDDRAAGVDAGDRAAAGADLDDVDDRHHHRVARPVRAPLDAVLGRGRHRRVLDQRALRGRAADIEVDEVGLADALADPRRARDAARRARLDQRDRPRARRGEPSPCRRWTASRAAVRAARRRSAASPARPGSGRPPAARRR